MLQSKVEETLRRAVTQAEMFRRQDDFVGALSTLDAGIQYGDENDACLTAEARVYKTRLYEIKSICIYHLVSLYENSVCDNTHCKFY